MAAVDHFFVYVLYGLYVLCVLFVRCDCVFLQHLGNLLPLATLLRCRQRGLPTVVVLGGFTALIGDPSGRASERSMVHAAYCGLCLCDCASFGSLSLAACYKQLDESVVEANKASIERTVRRIVAHGDGYVVYVLSFVCNKARTARLNKSARTICSPDTLIVDNREWYDSMSALALLRDVGKRFAVSSMLARESVRARLDADGISFTEFTYQLLQAHDFEELRRRANVRVQLGGSDQYGNICAGVDYVRKVSRDRVAGITQPLLLSSTGEKLGKSAGNAGTTWLDAALTSPFELFQFLLQLPDEDAAAALPRLSPLRPLEQVDELLAAQQRDAAKREVQLALASDVVSLVHGSESLSAVQSATSLLFGTNAAELRHDAASSSALLDVLDKMPHVR